MKKKLKLKIEIIPDKISNKTTVLIWEGLVIVSNETVDGLLENTNEEKEKIAKEYQKNV